jgi:hypothetical protein
MFVFTAIGEPKQTILAQETYEVCYVRVPNAGDPIRNGYSGPPSHEYWSETFDAGPLVRYGNHLEDQYMTWIRKHYASSWVYNGYSLSYGESVACMAMTLDEYKDIIKGDAFTIKTATNWPAVTDFK